MTTIQNAISIRITSIVATKLNDRENARRAFWESRLRFTDDLPRSRLQSDSPVYQTVEYWEEKINREFGFNLQRRLIQGYSYALRISEDFERRTIIPEGSPAYRKMMERYANLSTVAIQASISSYSSLTIDLTFTGVQHLIEAFDADFDSFRVFLEGFIHPAFGSVVGEQFADQMNYKTNPSTELVTEFNEARKTKLSVPIERSVETKKNEMAPSLINQAGEKARFAWLLANTSLVVPVILALIVVFFAYQEFSNTRNSYNTAFQAVLEQQSKLIDEDKERLAIYNHLLESIINQYLQDANNLLATPVAQPKPPLTPTITATP